MVSFCKAMIFLSEVMLILTFNEKKRYFVSECKQKNILMKMLIEVDEKIKNNGATDELEKKKESLTARLNYINDVMSKIDDPIIRNCIECLWIRGWSIRKTVIYNNQISPSWIYEKINHEIREIL